MFVVFEGIDGCGKTTISKLFTEKLKNEGKAVIWTNEPNSDTEFGLDIRNIFKKHETKLDALTEFLLFYASRVEHLNKIIIPAIKNGETVICDRYVHSSFAYQGAAGLCQNIMSDIHCGVFNNFLLKKDLSTSVIYPDIVFWIDTDIDICMGRNKKADAKDRMPKEYYEKCRNYYSDLYNTRGYFPFIYKINGNQPADAVLSEILDVHKTSINRLEKMQLDKIYRKNTIAK